MRAYLSQSTYYGPGHHGSEIAIHTQGVSPLGSHQGLVCLDEEWADLSTFLQWIKICDETHADCRQPFSPSDVAFTIRDMYAISVSKSCLVRLASGQRYAALSYVWGDEHGKFRTSKANLETLMQQGSLSSPQIQGKLPGVVKSAMVLTSSLGLEYLWIDALCIVHDDPLHVESQINNMAKIYSSSYLTICAADGPDAESSLRGVPGTFRPRHAKQAQLTFSTEDSKAARWIQEITPNEFSWYTRGWTFQEYMLSPRVLVFRDNGLEWRCNEMFATEQDPIGQPLHQLRLFRREKLNGEIEERLSEREQLHREKLEQEKLTNVDTRWPCLEKWHHLLETYLKRELRYEGDILRAFSGIEQVLELGFSGGFHYGLPELFFDTALLWTPDEPLSRRKSLREDNNGSQLPPWSWAAWKGLLSYKKCFAGLSHIRSGGRVPPPITIEPLVQWFKLCADSDAEVEIENYCYKHRSISQIENPLLPPGWSRERDGTGTVYYDYDQAPGETSFWYPIPISRDARLSAARETYTPVLHCKTWRVRLNLWEHLDTEEDIPGCEYVLYDKQKEPVGIVHIDEPHRLCHGTQIECELVVISGGCIDKDRFDSYNSQFVSQDLSEWDALDFKDLENGYSWYNLLWIERSGILACRKGLARVEKSRCDKLLKEEIELYLA